jgi:hypothetical protein
LFRAPFLQLFWSEKISYLDQIFNGPLFLLRLEFDDFRILSPDGLYFYGRTDKKFPKLQASCKKLCPKELGYSKVGLLNQLKGFPLFRGEIEFGCPPAWTFSSPLFHSHPRWL